MADTPVNSDHFPVSGDKLRVTPENASQLTVHFLSQIYSRLGYMIKLLEGKKNG